MATGVKTFDPPTNRWLNTCVRASSYFYFRKFARCLNWLNTCVRASSYKAAIAGLHQWCRLSTCVRASSYVDIDISDNVTNKSPTSHVRASSYRS